MSGAFHPEPESIFYRDTCALNGGSFTKIYSSLDFAKVLLRVGGILKLTLILIYGIITLPALLTGLNPLIPVTVSWGLQVLFRTSYRVFSEAHRTPSKKVKSLTLPLPMILASFSDSSYLLAGTSTQKSWWIFPFYRFSILWIKILAILETLGTTPEESPLCTPSEMLPTLKTPATMPLNELVIQSRS